MKVLYDWRKLLKKFKFIFPLLLGTVLFAEDNYLSTNKEKLFNYSYEKAIEDSNKLENDWINPITYKYMYSNTETYDTHKSMISISQPIFKSGGIYYAVKYAKSTKNKTNISIDIEKKELIKQTISLLFEIQKLDISVAKQELLIKNAKLDVERKKEQVLNGILDTSFLDNAILDSNSKQNTFIDLLHQRVTLTNNLSKLSHKKYEEIELPIFTITNNDMFLENNLYIKKAKDEINTSYWFKNMVRSNYLPTVNVTADYTKYHDTGNNQSLDKETSETYGINISIPLDIKYSNTIQSAKIEYLQNKIALADKIHEEKVIFDNSISKINSIDKKIKIASSDISLYDSLVTQIKEQLDVGMKTQSDVQTIQNSKKIKVLEIESLNIEKQIELLEIYSRMAS